jgi:hypothetical protein
LNLDLAPTLLDFAGVPVPKEIQGRSWRRLLAGERVPWREDWFYEYFAERQNNSKVPDITAVRTDGEKLIKYPGHGDWTELFDLRTDPYETRNLFLDPAHATLRARLEAAHERLVRETGYRVPDFVDRPDWWDKPGGADGKPDSTPELRLHFDFTQLQLDGARVPDSSGQNNHGTSHSAVLADGRDGRKALLLKDGAFVEVPRSKSLNPAGNAWTVEVVIRADAPDGVILARGGRVQGYALWLEKGRPRITVRMAGQPVTVEAKEAVSGWTTLTGSITADRKATLHINGQLAGTTQLAGFIRSDPTDTMQLGADLNSTLVEPAPSKFTGLIEHVRIFKGEATGGFNR